MLILTLTGCSSYLSRTRAYSVLPLAPEEFNQLNRDFLAVRFDLSPMLAASEKGLAWEMVVRFGNGEKQTFLATSMMYFNHTGEAVSLDKELGAQLFSLLPFSELEAENARAIVVSHDHSWCARLDGSDIGWCGSSLDDEEFNWQRDASLLSDFTEVVQVDSISHDELRLAYEKALHNNLIKEENFGGLKEYLEMIENRCDPWPPVIKITLSTGLTMLVVSLAASPIAGAITASLTAGLETSNVLISLFGFPDLNHPEYMNGFARNYTIGRFKLDFYRSHNQIAQAVKVLADNQKNLAGRVEQLEEQNRKLTAHIQELEKIYHDLEFKDTEENLPQTEGEEVPAEEL